MDLDITLAVERANAKRGVLAALAHLPKAAWRDLMVEMLVEQGVLANGTQTPVASAIAVTGPPSGSQATSAASHRGAGTKTDELISLLTQTPKTHVRDLAAKVYGSDDAGSIKKTTALLRSLTKQGRAKKAGRGKWEVTQPKA